MTAGPDGSLARSRTVPLFVNGDGMRGGRAHCAPYSFKEPE